MSMKIGGDKAGPMADINVTPMADIMIVLLIIFMVITPLLQKGVDVKLPTAQNTKERKDAEKTMTVAVRTDGKTYFRGKPLDNIAELPGLVKQSLEELPDDQKVLYLKADEKAEYSEVVKVMDLCREGGVEEVALIAERRTQG
jgi:biopolymer transport protein ExbD